MSIPGPTMRNLLFAVVLVLIASSKPAEACRLGPCPPAVQALGYTLAAGLAGAYIYGVSYNVYHDVTDSDQTLGWGIGEFTANGLGVFIAGGGTISALRAESYGAAAVLAPFALLHTTLMVHGGWRAYNESDELRLPDNGLLWLGGTAYTANTLLWASQVSSRRGRAFGIAEAAVNGPIAIGLGYLAYDRFATWRGGAGFAYGGMAAISAAFTIHGLRTAISPPRPVIDTNAMDLYPTVVDDGKELAPGLGLSGTW
jgi:hypothetical protein